VLIWGEFMVPDRGGLLRITSGLPGYNNDDDS
jgi:hypothetical protein